MNIKLNNDDWLSIHRKKINENKVFDELIKNSVQKLETKKIVTVSEEELQQDIDALGDPWVLGRLQKRARGTGLTIRSDNDPKQNGGKRTYLIYNRKIMFAVCGT